MFDHISTYVALLSGCGSLSQLSCGRLLQMGQLKLLGRMRPYTSDRLPGHSRV